MTRAKRYQSPELEVQLLREGIIESVHIGHAVVCDSRGRMLSVAGDGDAATFIRSSLKPFQALAVAVAGTSACHLWGGGSRKFPRNKSRNKKRIFP